MPFGPTALKELDDDLSQLRKIPGYAGYYINEAGDVFTVRKLSQFRDKDGYARVSTKRLRAAIHTLLAKVFLSPPEPGQDEVRHLDGNPKNNALTNLAWGTRQQNAADMARHGTVKGSKNANAKLSEAQVRAIKRLLNSGANRRRIAETFGVSLSTIKAIREGRLWSHIEERELAEL